MLLYFAIALLGALFLLLSAVLGEVLDFFGDADVDGDVHPLSGKTIAVGMTAFGATGMITSYYDWDAALGALTAGAAALFMGAVAWWVIMKLYSDTASTDVSVGGMVGRRANVTVTIPPGSVGEVLLTTADSTRHMIARSRDGASVPAGTSVRIVETLGSVVIVEPVEQPAKAPESVQTA
jgi:membrane-bound ClpP family serine protease